MRKILFAILFLFCGVSIFSADAQTTITKKCIIIDNDFCGDPDGLFQLTHELLCSSCDIRGIVGGHLSASGFTHKEHSATLSCEKADTVLDLLGLKGHIKVVPGAQSGLTSTTEPIESDGARLIVEEARKCTKDKPLYVCCGASLTNIASAHLMDPSIDDKVVLIWIGGQDYKGLADGLPYDPSNVEFNLSLSIPAAQVIFNKSNIRVWQVPRGVYGQCMYGIDEMRAKIAPCGKIGEYLYKSIEALYDELKHYGVGMGEAYVLGDSPLVLLSSLVSDRANPASCLYKEVKAPTINDNGSYSENKDSRLIRVYYHLDTRLMFGDLESKLQQLKNKM